MRVSPTLPFLPPSSSPSPSLFLAFLCPSFPAQPRFTSPAHTLPSVPLPPLVPRPLLELSRREYMRYFCVPHSRSGFSASCLPPLVCDLGARPFLGFRPPLMCDPSFTLALSTVANGNPQPPNPKPGGPPEGSSPATPHHEPQNQVESTSSEASGVHRRTHYFHLVTARRFLCAGFGVFGSRVSGPILICSRLGASCVQREGLLGREGRGGAREHAKYTREGVSNTPQRENTLSLDPKEREWYGIFLLCVDACRCAHVVR